MSTLNLLSSLTIYEDSSASNNPQQRIPDWNRKVLGETVQNPQVDKISILPGDTKQIFSGTRITFISNSTAFDINPVSGVAGQYLVKWTGGSEPNFRFSRALTITTQTFHFAVNNGATMQVYPSAAVAGWDAIVVGDTFYIPPATSNVFDPTECDPINYGFWIVIGKSNSSTTATLSLVRRTGEVFSGISQVCTFDQNPIDFGPTGVQVGDTVEISQGFSPVTQQSFKILEVTPTQLWIFSATALPIEVGAIPSTAGMVVYSSAKRFVRIESDQELTVRFNNDSGGYVRISPRVSGTNSGYGWIEKWGPTWQLDLDNRSSVSPANIVIITAE